VAVRPGYDEADLVSLARAGGEDAYLRLVEVYRSELHAHCYRMLGSVHDAEDALQEAMLRAWRGLGRFEGRSSMRSWLYRIATNAALDVAKRRSRRELPTSYGLAAPAGEPPGPALLESVWVEPYPDATWAGGEASPEARYESRESLELAFVAALQTLPALQRAVVVLRDVLGFTTKEVAEQLGTTAAAVQSALQRGRAAARTRLPARSQQSALRSLGNEEITALVTRFVDAIERGDAEAVVALLTEDASWAMPPLLTWYEGPASIRRFLAEWGLHERWRHLRTSANGQIALGGYTLDTARRLWVPSVLQVLTLGDTGIAAVTGFVTSELLARWGHDDDRFVGADAFPAFGLPEVLTD
jgi:RNA polymerase sigma-70 factor (ECF subfamily)